MAEVQGRRIESLQTALQSPNILPQIVFVDGDLNEAMFLALLNQIPDAATFNKKFSHYEDTWRPLTDTVDGAVSGTTGTTIKVDTPLAFMPNHLWQNKRTGETYLVDSTSEGASTIDVQREIGRNSSDSTGVAAAAINDGDTLIRIGPSLGEVSTRQTAESTTTDEVFNYAEKKRYDPSMSDVQRKTELITGSDWEYQLDKTMKQARKDLNGWLYIGERNKAQINSQTHWFSGGLNFFISSNLETVPGTLHEHAFDQWLADEAMRYGRPEKTMLASMNMIRALNHIGKDYISIERANLGTKDMALGISVTKFMSPTGRTLNILEDRFLTEAFSGHAYVVDMNVVRMRHFSNNGLDGRLKLTPNTQDVDSDDFVATISGDIGLEVGPEKHHGKITGVTAGARGRSVS